MVTRAKGRSTPWCLTYGCACGFRTLWRAQVAPGNVFVRRLSKTQVTLPLKSSPLAEKKRSIGENEDDIPDGFGFK
eukprot:m.1132900 g.1132900  ORF g.1132900 m.1132900 type:complete len:76 (-) comp24426_c0_seq2:157-384(-)